MDYVTAEEHLQIIRTWAAVDRDYGGIRPACCDDIVKWIDEALEGMKPVPPEGQDDGARIDYRCGACGRWFCYQSKLHPEMGFRTKYCPHCGRRVKWDDSL